MANRILEKFRRGEKSLGIFTHMLSATAIEAMAYTGLDYAIIDIEHSPIAAEHAAELVGVAERSASARWCGWTPSSAAPSSRCWTWVPPA